MTDLNRLFAEEMTRRKFFRMAGVTSVGAAMLAACRRAEEGSGGTTTGASGEVVHAPIEEEPGGLKVFDWAGYGDGFYYPEKERRGLWQQYQDQTGDTPTYTVFDDDDSGYAKAASGAVTFDVTPATAGRASRCSEPSFWW